MPLFKNGISMDLTRESLLERYRVEYPIIYKNLIRDWQAPGEDTLWLLYSANYLFRSGEVRWAIDPMTLTSRISNDLPIDPINDFSKLNFLLLTHNHGDHVNWKFLNSISSINIPWVVPDFLQADLHAHVSISSTRVITPSIGNWLNISGIRILPLNGSHWETVPGISRLKGLPSMAYLLEFNQKRWFFPGDTRSFDITNIPDIGKLDGLISHVFLGRMKSIVDTPPLGDEFCGYFSGFDTRRIVLTHLYEIGREMKDIWTKERVIQILNEFKEVSPEISLSFACSGDSFKL